MGLTGSEGDYATVTVTVQAPGQLITKAVGEGQDAENLVFAVFDEEGNELEALRQGDWRKGQPELIFDNSAKPTVVVKTTLVRGKQYTFVCWAQNKEADCYDFTNMKEITVDYANTVAQNEKRDAFYAAVLSDIVVDNFKQEITLKRPFAQINVGTADIQAAELAGLEVQNLYSTMTVQNVANKLHTFVGAKAGDKDGDGMVSGSETVTFALAPAVSKSTFDGSSAAADHEWLTINAEGYQNKVYGWLSMNYFLVNDGDLQGNGSVDGTDQVTTDVTFKVYEGDALELCSYDVVNVPVQRNYRSHIIGNVLTAQGTLTVIIEPAFLNPDYVVNIWDGISTKEPASNAEGTEYYVMEASELAWVAAQVNSGADSFEGKTIVLSADIDLVSQVWTPIGTAENPFKGNIVGAKTATKAAEDTPVTVYGLKIDFTEGPAGLVGCTDAAVKNIILDEPKVEGESYVGALAGKVLANGSVESCTVNGGSVEGNYCVGGVVAYAEGLVKANTVDGTAVAGKAVEGKPSLTGGKVGLIAGAANADNIKDNHIDNATIEAADAATAGVVVGYVTEGTLNPKDNTYNHENITLNGEVVAPAEFKFNVTADETAFAVEGGELTINVEANVAWTVTASEGLVDVEEGEGNAVITVTAPANELTEEVLYTVVVATEEDVETKEYEIIFTQAVAAPEFVAATVAEFLAAVEDDTVYELTGMITSVTNTTYGNFYLKDSTGEVLIYGLCSPEGEQKYWAASGAKVGDSITVRTVRTSYNGTAQGKNALFVELKPFVAQASEWGVVGDLTGWGVNDINMVTTWHTENLFVAYNVEINSGAFKIRANNKWDDAKNYGLETAGSIYADSYYTVITSGGSQNITPMEYGTYDVYFDLTNKRVALMTPGKEYSDAKDGGAPVVVVAGLKDHSWGMIGNFDGSNWTTDVEMVVEGDWAVAKNVTLAEGNAFKFRADGAWTLSYGAGCNVVADEEYVTYNNGGDMKFTGEAGAYDIYFSLIDAKFYMEKHVEKTEYTAILTFDDKAKRTNYTTTQQVWEENGIIFTNDKYKSTNNVADYANPARFYKGSSLTVAVEGEITEIVFDCSSSSYATELKNSIGDIDIVSSDKEVTVTFAESVSSFEVAQLTAQVRLDAITVTYLK